MGSAWQRIVASAAQTLALEWLGVALALAYLLLAVRQRRACWHFALASSLVYLLVFARTGLYMQAALQVFYAGMAVYGWWSWRPLDGAGARTIAVSRWPWPRHIAVISIVAALALANGAWLHATQSAAVAPYLDALISWGSVATTWLVARKVLENWLYWIVLDLAAAGLFWSQGLAATALLFVAYAAIAVQGYRRWRGELASGATLPAGIGHD
jgi:nicotinamide mononucleotide transporter